VSGERKLGFRPRKSAHDALSLWTGTIRHKDEKRAGSRRRIASFLMRRRCDRLRSHSLRFKADSAQAIKYRGDAAFAASSQPSALPFSWLVQAVPSASAVLDRSVVFWVLGLHPPLAKKKRAASGRKETFFISETEGVLLWPLPRSA
jgi:hypothetical protein